MPYMDPMGYNNWVVVHPLYNPANQSFDHSNVDGCQGRSAKVRGWELFLDVLQMSRF